MDPLVVMIVGMAVVFAGLILLIGIVKLVSLIYKLLFNKTESENAKVASGNQPAVYSANNSSALTDTERREMIVAISAAIAETIGKPVAGIRIKSIRKLG